MSPTPVLDGRVLAHQPVRGYRFAVDSLLLAAFVLSRRTGPAAARGLCVELGGGCGIVSALVLAGNGFQEGVAVEIQTGLHRAAQRTAVLNGLDGRLRCLRADLRTLRGEDLPARPAAVFSNPPFHPAHAGHVPPSRGEALARHEVSATMDDVLAAAARLLPDRAALFLTYPAPRLPDLMVRLPRHALHPVTLAWVHPRLDEPACRFLIEARRTAARRLTVLAPWTIHGPDRGAGPWYRLLAQRVDAARS